MVYKGDIMDIERNELEPVHFFVSKELKKRFKVICLIKEKSLSETLKELVEKYVQENQNIIK